MPPRGWQPVGDPGAAGGGLWSRGWGFVIPSELELYLFGSFPELLREA
jgi:hypothetical protein